MRIPNADHLTQDDIAASNSLADLAARIRAEHEAAAAFLGSGLERAINAGGLLSRSQGTDRSWPVAALARRALPGARADRAGLHAGLLARSRKLDAAKSATVADLSFRDALSLIGHDRPHPQTIAARELRPRARRRRGPRQGRDLGPCVVKRIPDRRQDRALFARNPAIDAAVCEGPQDLAWPAIRNSVSGYWR